MEGLDDVVMIGKTKDPLRAMHRNGAVIRRQAIDLVKLIEGDVVKDLTQNLERIDGFRSLYKITNEVADQIYAYQDANEQYNDDREVEVRVTGLQLWNPTAYVLNSSALEFASCLRLMETHLFIFSKFNAWFNGSLEDQSYYGTQSLIEKIKQR